MFAHSFDCGDPGSQSVAGHRPFPGSMDAGSGAESPKAPVLCFAESLPENTNSEKTSKRLTQVELWSGQHARQLLQRIQELTRQPPGLLQHSLANVELSQHVLPHVVETRLLCLTR